MSEIRHPTNTAMNLLIIISMSLAFFADFLIAELGLGTVAKLWPEVISGFAVLVLVSQFAGRKRFDLAPKYTLWLFAMGAVVVAGILANGMAAGGTIVGMREYLKFVPFFLIPVVYRFSVAQVSQQFRWLLIFAILQLPIVLYQLFREIGLHSGRLVSGDLIAGTLQVSSVMSVILISVWSMMFAFAIRKHISLKAFVAASAVLLLPTMLNETKGSLVLLPVAALAPFFARPGKPPWGRIVFVTLVVGVLAGAYSKIDEFLLGETKSTTMAEMFTDPQQLWSYLSPQAEGRNWIGRADKINMALEELSKDPVKMMLGVGIGNASESPVRMLAGDYAAIAENRLIGVGANRLFWETGLFGLTLMFVFMFLVARDSQSVSRHAAGLTATMANGWFAVVVLQALSMLYIDPIRSEAMSMLFWFYSGLVVAEKARMSRQFVEQRFMLNRLAGTNALVTP